MKKPKPNEKFEVPPILMDEADKFLTRHEFTSDWVASIAARGLRNPTWLSNEEIKAICASALTQIKSKPNVG